MRCKALGLVALALLCVGATSQDNIKRMLDTFDINTYQALTDIASLADTYEENKDRPVEDLERYNSYYENALERLTKQAGDKIAIKQQFDSIDKDLKTEIITFKRLQEKTSSPVRAQIQVASSYGERVSPTDLKTKETNNGVDLYTPIGTRVQSIFKGQVTVEDGDKDDTYNVTVDTDGKCKITYYNITSVKYKTGDEVKSGQALGTTINSLDTDWPIIHIEARFKDEIVDPTILL